MNLVKSTTKIGLAEVGNAILNFVAIVYFARLLGSGGLGIFFLFKATTGIGSLISDLGIQGAVEKRISEQDSPSEILATGIFLKFVLVALTGALILLFQPHVNDYIGVQVAPVLALAIAIQGFSTLMIKVMNAELRVGETAIIRLSQQTTWLVVSIILVQLGVGVVSLIYGLISGLIVSLLWAGYKSNTTIGSPSVEGAKSIYEYAKYNFVASASWRVHNWADVAILGFFMSSSFVGAYEIAWRVSAFISLAVKSITTTMFPQISAWEATGERAKIESLLPKTLVWSLVLVVPAFFGAIVFSKEILTLVFGQEYGVASTVLIILMGEKLLSAVYRPMKRILEGMDHVNLSARLTTMGMVTNVSLNILLIQRFGIEGAAVATTTSILVMAAMATQYTSNFLSIEYPYRKCGWMVISALVMTALIWGMRVVHSPATLPYLLLYVAAGALIYLAGLGFSSELRSDLRQLSR